MHIERKPLEELATMSLDQLCDIDLQYKAEIERLQGDRGSMRTILHARAIESGVTQTEAVERHRLAVLRAVPAVEIKA